jgi:hypothetical protein
MSNYSPSTIAKTGELNPKCGLVCRTATTLNTSTFTTTATNIFKVTGRIRIVSLDVEAITAFSANASVPRWQILGVTPVVALFDISAASSTLSGLAVGKRVTFPGTALTTAQVIDGVAGITVKAANLMDVGWDGGVCYLALDSDVVQTGTTATSVFTLCYLPQSDGAAAEALF